MEVNPEIKAGDVSRQEAMFTSELNVQSGLAISTILEKRGNRPLSPCHYLLKLPKAACEMLLSMQLLSPAPLFPPEEEAGLESCRLP